MFSRPSDGKKQRGQGVVRVGTLFEKYKKTLRAPERSVIEAFIATVGDVIPNARITPHECAYSPRTRTLSLRAAGPLRTEILLNKSEILSEMRTLLGTQNTPTEIV